MPLPRVAKETGTATPQDARERLAFSRSQIWLAVLLFAVGLLNYVDRQVLSVLVPVMRAEIGLTPLQYSWVINAFLIAYGVMYTGSGFVLDRLGARIGLALFVAVWSIASGLHAAASGFSGLLAFRFFLGLAEPGGWTGAIKSIAQNFSPVQRGLASAIFTSGSTVAMVIAPPLITFLSLHFGWRAAFLIPSAAGLVWVPLWLRINGRLAPNRIAAELSRHTFPVKALLRDPQTLGYALARFFGDSSGYFFVFWLPDYLHSQKGFSIAMIGALGWIPYLFSDLGPLVGGLAATRLIAAGVPPLRARKLVMSAAPLLVAVGMLSVSASEFWIVLASISAAMLGVGIWAVNLHALPADVFIPARVATAYGFAGSAGALGGVLFNSLVGYFSQRSNYTGVFAVLLALQPLGLAGLWLLVRRGEPERGENG